MWRFGGLACLEKMDVLQAAIVVSVRRASPVRNIAGWRETGEEMAGNGGVFLHELLVEQLVLADRMPLRILTA